MYRSSCSAHFLEQVQRHEFRKQKSPLACVTFWPAGPLETDLTPKGPLKGLRRLLITVP